MKLFGGSKPDHPLADPKEAKRLLDALPANDPVKALDELAHWVESVAALEGFTPEARIQLLIALHGYWKQAAYAYARSVDQFAQGHKRHRGGQGPAAAAGACSTVSTPSPRQDSSRNPR